MARPDVVRLRRSWDKQSRYYDRSMGFWERKLFGHHREWVAIQATGEVLEVAVGTGLNLPLYPAGVRLTGVDLSPGMLEIARRRAQELGLEVELHETDAHALPFAEGSFDTVVCTYSLCNIPDLERAVAEMKRVLRPGGRLLLLDNIAGTSKAQRVAQWLIERVLIPLQGEHLRRRPLHQVEAAGFQIQQRQRLRHGIVERIAAHKPPVPTPSVDENGSLPPPYRAPT